MNMPNRILVRALELIELGWTQGAFARDSTGRSVPIGSPLACQWCSDGARNRAKRELNASPTDSEVARKALEAVMGDSISGFNDPHTKAEVVAAFKAAIESTK